MLADHFSCRKHPKTEVTVCHFMDREDGVIVLWVSSQISQFYSDIAC